MSEEDEEGGEAEDEVAEGGGVLVDGEEVIHGVTLVPLDAGLQHVPQPVHDRHLADQAH